MPLGLWFNIGALITIVIIRNPRNPILIIKAPTLGKVQELSLHSTSLNSSTLQSTHHEPGKRLNGRETQERKEKAPGSKGLGRPRKRQKQAQVD